MAGSSDNKVVVRVEVEVGGACVVKPVFQKLFATDYPEPWPKDTPVINSGGQRFIPAHGNRSMGSPPKPAVIVRAKVYADPNLNPNDAQYKEPPADAPHDVPAPNGTWSFSATKNNLLPAPTCDADQGSLGQGDNNSTLLVWYAFLGLDHWVIEDTKFHAYCPPGSGTSGASGTSGTPSGSGLIGFGSQAVPAVLHATFLGSLAPLTTVPLAWNGLCWVGMSPALGGVLLAFNSAGMTCTLLSPGPGIAFMVAGAPASFTPFVWSGAGAATGAGAGAGPFNVTVTE
jgi:hypothetical protein